MRLAGLDIVQHRVSMTERSAFHVLSVHPHGMAFQAERCKRESFPHCPVDGLFARRHGRAFLKQLGGSLGVRIGDFLMRMKAFGQSRERLEGLNQQRHIDARHHVGHVKFVPTDEAAPQALQHVPAVFVSGTFGDFQF